MMSGGLRLLGRLAGSLLALSLPRPGASEIGEMAEGIPVPAPRGSKSAGYAEEDCD